MRAFARKRPLSAFFALAFTISWGGLLLAAGGPGGIPVAPDDVLSLLPLFVACVLLGPSVSGILLTGLVDGRAGFRDLRRRLLRWRVGARVYAGALLLAPVVIVAVLSGLSLISPRFRPAVFVADDPVAVLVAGIAIGLGAGFFEELGWTGFAIPMLRRRYSVRATGLIVGVIWAAWHLLPAFWLSGAVSGRLALPSYMLDPFLFLVVFRVLMVRVYDRTQSMPLAILMHGSLTFSARVFTPQGIAGVPLLTFDLAWAAIIWLIILLPRSR